MASVYDLKPGFQKLLHPCMVFLSRHKVTPNAITLVALGGSFIAGSLFLIPSLRHGAMLVLPLWLFVRMALNALDGMMAREFHMSSYEGFLLNEAGDVLSDTVLYFPLVFCAPGAIFAIALFCLGSIFSEFCGVLPKASGLSRRYEGPMGKSDRAFWVGALSLVAFFAEATVVYWEWCFFLFFLLTAVSSYNRLASSKRELTAKGGKIHD